MLRDRHPVEVAPSRISPEEQPKMQELIDDTYSNFLASVAQARGMDQDAVRELATGEVYLAERARELGLVDELGDLDRAIDIAAPTTHESSAP